LVKEKGRKYDGQKIDENARVVKGKINEKFRALKFPYLADLRLKCCILKESAKNRTSGRNIA